MGKPIRAQRIGTGSPRYRVPSFNWICDTKYIPLSDKTLLGWVNDILHDPGRNAPVAEILLEDGKKMYVIAWEGAFVGQKIYIGPEAPLEFGNILPLKNVPEGYPVFNVENVPGDGGQFARASGTYCIVFSKTEDEVILKMPSGKLKAFHPECRACIGVAAGGGRKEKPLRKAGNKYHLMHTRGKRYPYVRGVAMNAVDHPHGGKSSSKKPGPTTVARNTPPGRKVGHIAARRTGRRYK